MTALLATYVCQLAFPQRDVVLPLLSIALGEGTGVSLLCWLFIV